MNSKAERARRGVSQIASVATVLQNEMDRFYLEDGQLQAFQELQDIVSVLIDEVWLTAEFVEDLAHDSEVVDAIRVAKNKHEMK